MHFSKIKNLLIDPVSKKKITFENNNFFSENKKYELVSEILNMFENDNATDDITNKQKKFYEDIMFPNYDDLDDFSSSLNINFCWSRIGVITPTLGGFSNSHNFSISETIKSDSILFVLPLISCFPSCSTN